MMFYSMCQPISQIELLSKSGTVVSTDHCDSLCGGGGWSNGTKKSAARQSQVVAAITPQRLTRAEYTF